jgi:hypothetical protein
MTPSHAARDRRRAAARQGRSCAHCNEPISPQRSTGYYCSDRHRLAAWRCRHATSAHQRQIADRQRALDPQPREASLKGYTVRLISRLEALPLIRDYEWLGNFGHAHIFVGLLSPRGDLHGVEAFGPGPCGQIGCVLDGPSLCLERGCCRHDAPKNAASFLISRALKLVREHYGISKFYAYADPAAGEYGGVYQAAGWAYLGQGLHGRCGNRRHREYCLPPGGDPANPAHWRTDRDLRRPGRRLTFAEAKAAGWRIEMRPCKHLYARVLDCPSLVSLPYPAPHPERKRGSMPSAPPANTAPTPAAKPPTEHGYRNR